MKVAANFRVGRGLKKTKSGTHDWTSKLHVSMRQNECNSKKCLHVFVCDRERSYKHLHSHISNLKESRNQRIDLRNRINLLRHHNSGPCLPPSCKRDFPAANHKLVYVLKCIILNVFQSRSFLFITFCQLVFLLISSKPPCHKVMLQCTSVHRVKIAGTF